MYLTDEEEQALFADVRRRADEIEHLRFDLETARRVASEMESERDAAREALHRPLKEWNPDLKRWLAESLLKGAAEVDGYPSVTTYAALAEVATLRALLAESISHLKYHREENGGLRFDDPGLIDRIDTALAKEGR